MEWMDHSLQMIWQYTLQQEIREWQPELCMGSRERFDILPPTKTVSMIFRKRNEEPMEIMLRNEIIPSKESTQFLGMTLDSRLNWEEQIKSQNKESIKYYKGGSWKEMGRRSKNPKKLYCAICRTKIDYGCQIYNTGIRIYTEVFRTSPIESICVEANDPPWN